ncbi:MAG: sigma-54-dependent transcriptional regulator [Acidobacteriota bacterium]
MPVKGSILLIDDEEIMREVITRLLSVAGYAVTAVGTGEEGIERVAQDDFDLVLLDLMLPGMGGLEVLERILQPDPDLVVVIISAYASIENAVTATKGGAFDFITKPFKNDELLLVVKNGIEKRHLSIENRQLRKNLRTHYSFGKIVGKSQQMRQIFSLIAQVGPGRSTVLITGESGTGKELVARAIHQFSPRSEGHFMPVNSGSIPFDLLESELFGHVRGAFTGATSSKKGLFEVADGGTLFLDEVGNLPLDTQAKLLRVIQEREFRRVGGLDSIKIDVRIIAATNSDLKLATDRGEFREDLYYRLNVIRISLPRLRERKDDIPLLAEHFLRRFCEENERPICSLDPEALRLLMEYDWPGNVRELENVIERAVVLAPPDGRITEDLFPREILESTSVNLGKLNLSDNGASLRELVHEYERNLITSALKKTDWNQKRAASLLRVNPTTLNEKLKRLRIKIP